MIYPTKYTFLLPAYKAKFLAESLESIKNQTHKDFLCIVSDDCSPENLKSTYDEVVGTDSRFTYRRNDENMGGKSLVSHWNFLVETCETEFFIMASDDDMYASNFLEEINVLTKKYADVNIFRGRTRMIDAEGEVTWQDCLIDEYTTQIEFLRHFFIGNCSKNLGQYVFRTKELKTKGGFYDLPLAWGSDDATAIIMSESGICHTPSIDFSFRMSGLNISSTGSPTVLKEKTRGRYIFVSFLFSYIEKLKTGNLTKYQKTLISKVSEHALCSNYVSSLVYGAELRAFKDMIPYYQLLDKIGFFNGKLDKLHFFWTWLKAYKTR